MSKSKKIEQAPIVAAEAKPSLYMLRLPKETRTNPLTYIVPAGTSMGKERWLAKKSYNVKQDAQGLYVILSEAQHLYYAKEGIEGMEPYTEK